MSSQAIANLRPGSGSPNKLEYKEAARTLSTGEGGQATIAKAQQGAAEASFESSSIACQRVLPATQQTVVQREAVMLEESNARQGGCSHLRGVRRFSTLQQRDHAVRRLARTATITSNRYGVDVNKPTMALIEATMVAKETPALHGRDGDENGDDSPKFLAAWWSWTRSEASTSREPSTEGHVG